MFIEKVKKYFENLSTIKFLGYRDFIILDVNEKSGKLGYIKSSSNPLNIFNTSIPNHKIIYQKEIEIKEENYFEINRELRILLDKNKLNSAVLLIILNNYKSFNIILSKDGKEDSEEIDVLDLIKLQLPQNLISGDFFIQYEKTGEDENLENYLVSVTRIQELQRLTEIFDNEIFQLKIAVPSIYLLTNQSEKSEPITSLIELNQEIIVHSRVTADKKVFTDEYYNINGDASEIEENLKQILSELPINSIENEEGFKNNIVFCTDRQYSYTVSKTFSEFDNSRSANLSYSIDPDAKFQLAYQKGVDDKILNFSIDENLPVKKKFDLERNVTNRLVISAFGLILILLLILNISNMFIDNSISEISEQKEDRKTIEIQVDQLDKNNNQLKADLHSLGNLKDGNQRISKILKIISDSSIEQMALTDLKLIKNELNNINIKLNGESYSKNEVISFIKNLESNKSLQSIELIGMNKNNEVLSDDSESIFAYKFTISMKFNDNKNS